eukprot:11964353-Alexandrium_andersonii.AAC.1
MSSSQPRVWKLGCLAPLFTVCCQSWPVDPAFANTQAALGVGMVGLAHIARLGKRSDLRPKAIVDTMWMECASVRISRAPLAPASHGSFLCHGSCVLRHRMLLHMQD